MLPQLSLFRTQRMRAFTDYCREQAWVLKKSIFSKAASTPTTREGQSAPRSPYTDGTNASASFGRGRVGKTVR
jgi:hypothetical protein